MLLASCSDDMTLKVTRGGREGHATPDRPQAGGRRRRGPSVHGLCAGLVSPGQPSWPRRRLEESLSLLNSC